MNNKAFLYDTFLQEFGKKRLENASVPNFITDNLKSGFGQRAYQIEAFKRYILFHTENFEGKPSKPYHLLYNMATGSGKTLVMAGLMLYLYEKGYRNFLFFVNSNNIIKKTKDNFLNPQASKYLFSNKIVIGGKEIQIKETDTFESADKENINIVFTTIQQLHHDLNDTKENSVTYEDFKDKKLVLIADEAHHLSSATKNKGALFGSWEGTVLEILKQSYDNILLEFTATLDYKSKEIIAKYSDKVIFKYDLSQFRQDKYSKEINLFRSNYDEQERIIQALILNLYRQELATSNYINLKPVILFKAKKTIKESEQNKANFHQLINQLSAEKIDNIRETSTVSVIQKAFSFFDSKNMPSSVLARRIKFNFRFENCLSANEDKEAEKNQLLLNTLEDENNPVRAIFAVQKLNEGWDVLNLFDIVRLYEGQNSGGSNKTIGNTTLAEAQLIGRGARYFPFALERGQDKYTRKYDHDPNNDLKILEELHYHTKEDSRYISELKTALIESGIYEDENKFEIKELFMKEEFKKTDFYLYGKVFINEKIEKSYQNVKSFADLGVSKRDFIYHLSSGAGKISVVFEETEESSLEKLESVEPKNIKISEIPSHILAFGLAQNPFFYLDSLQRYFPNVASLANFMTSPHYLGSLGITFKGSTSRLSNISYQDYFRAVQGLLQSIESEIKLNLTEFEGDNFVAQPINKIFKKEKKIKVEKGTIKSNGQEELVGNKAWYAYNANYGTIEEKRFVELFARKFEEIEAKFTNIFLIRNERDMKIFNKFGEAFEPDFLLFCKQKQGKELNYQVFIEPKGVHLSDYDQWKADFLKEIQEESLKIDSKDYLITAVPFFYNSASENDFKKSLENVLDI